MSLVGEILDPDDEVCGVVASSRPKIDRIQIWTRGRDDVERLNAIGRRVWEGMALEGGEVKSVSMEFQVNYWEKSPAAFSSC
jgi:translation initiation factor 4E